ncbi:MAG: hypothetical protein RKP46_03200 [Candidatus Accumulibacter sp.]|uniref:hypothetical protein n=1 Tax=Accumulibacter sp. TaxID=2053492 RepID=UPI00287839DF|nr:hypothetical protein [Accumulibacter sp.]MDS4013346.1 hypothetical protein [Accumulibacter sp.]HNB68871.1 hypothetical protein [Accumulibacter sp.]
MVATARGKPSGRLKAGKPLPVKPPARGGGAARSSAGARQVSPGAAARWQRTVRYAWDKGGSRGGR